MSVWNIYRLEQRGSGLVAKHLMQVKAKTRTHALQVAMTKLELTDPLELLRLSVRDTKVDQASIPTE